jgi:hypothetical protein
VKPLGFNQFGVAGDPLIALVWSLIHADGVNGNNNRAFLDSGPNGYVVTPTGNPLQGSVAPYAVGGGSAQFVTANADYLQVASNANLSLGTGDFTVEFWFFPTSSAQSIMFDLRAVNNAVDGFFVLINAGAPTVATNNTNRITGAAQTLNAWHHLAVTRAAGTLRMFIDGIAVNAGVADVTNVPAGANRPMLGGSGYQVGTFGYTGGLSDVRVVKGQALYTPPPVNFTPPAAPYPDTAPDDPSFASVRLLIHGETGITDSSPSGLAVTAGAGAALSATQKKFGANSIRIPSGGYLRTAAIPAAANFPRAGSPGTIEGWFWIDSLAARQHLFGAWSASSGWTIDVNPGGDLTIVFNSANAPGSPLTLSPKLTAAGWVHFAVVNTGAALNYYVNGVLAGTSGTFTPAVGTNFQIGARNDGSVPFAGYVEDFRYTDGVARPVVAFAPPTAPLTAVPNTQLLLSFTNAGVSDLTKRRYWSTVGDAKLSTAQSKFGGASIAFDGTGDYVLANLATDMALGTADFTIEFWAYCTSLTGNQAFMDFRAAASVAPLIYHAAGVLTYDVNGTVRISGGLLVVNTWNHIAVSRAAGSTRMFLNGVQVGVTYADANNYVAGASRPTLGATGYTLGQAFLFGFMDEIRVTKGIGRYVANFAPPAAAFPDTGPPLIEYLIAAGGGAGGPGDEDGGGGGGGGGGGVLTGFMEAPPVGGSITGAVGLGGTVLGNPAASGQNSSFGGLTAIGGGGGASGIPGLAGGSGGGSGRAQPGGAGTAGQGFKGGTGTGSPASRGGTGGGGATQAGGDSAGGTAATGGGAGLTSSISGAALGYGLGGGGGNHGSAGGGGPNGGGGVGIDGRGNGGGGGGNGGIAGAHSGGIGGTGTVIAAYKTGSMVCTGGSISQAGGNTIHTFPVGAVTLTRTA